MSEQPNGNSAVHTQTQTQMESEAFKTHKKSRKIGSVGRGARASRVRQQYATNYTGKWPCWLYPNSLYGGDRMGF